MNKDGISILINSCDNYADLWPPFLFFFKKYWGDCPYPRYLMTETEEFPDPFIKTIKSGEDCNWASSLFKALDQIGAKYVLLLMDDYFLQDKPNQAFLDQAILFMRENEVSYLRLFPRPAPEAAETTIGKVGVGRIARAADYRVSTQASIWDVDYLRRLVKPDESIWEFEIKGTERSRDMDDKLYSVVDENQAPLSYFCTAVVKGYWDKKAVQLCRENNLSIDLKKRRAEPFYINRNIRPIIELIALKNNLLRKVDRLFRARG